jgi:hypothetical protein
MLERFRAQVLRWKEIIQKEISAGSHDLIDRCTDRLLKEDPDLRAFELMAPDIQKRERFFMMNSVRGYSEFLQNAG